MGFLLTSMLFVYVPHVSFPVLVKRREVVVSIFNLNKNLF
jgi:hypothetical protein